MLHSGDRKANIAQSKLNKIGHGGLPVYVTLDRGVLGPSG